VNWIRGALLALMLGVLLLALSQTATKAPPLEPTPAPTPAPTRVPLPTLPPEVVVSRVSRDAQPTPTAMPAASEPRVEVVDYGYSPAQMVLQVGERVTWINDGSDGHDVTGTGPGGDWRSGPLTPQQRYSRIFALPGTYEYECTLHPEMRGRVVVQP
jgi:plastocyanin